MMKVFVAQTHENERNLVTDFLKAAKYDVCSSPTDGMSLVWMAREMLFTIQPFVVVSSQRDLLGCDFVSNQLHTAALCMMPKTLTIVYSRALMHQESAQGVIRYLADLSGTTRHQLKFVPKDAENTRQKEHATILTCIQEFERGLEAA